MRISRTLKTFFLKSYAQNVVAKLLPDLFLKNQNQSKSVKVLCSFIPALLQICGVFHTSSIFFRFALKQVYVLGNSSLFLYQYYLHYIIFLFIIYLLTTDCYILSVKIMAKCNKNDCVGWIILCLYSAFNSTYFSYAATKCLVTEWNWLLQ